MHLTTPAAKVWIMAALVSATVNFGGGVAAEALTPPAAEKLPADEGLERDFQEKLAQRVTLDLRNQSFADVARIISQMYGLSMLIYPDVAADTRLRVSVEAKDQCLREVLDDIVEQAGLHYHLAMQSVIIGMLPPVEHHEERRSDE